jgi:hypothetical protein
MSRGRNHLQYTGNSAPAAPVLLSGGDTVGLSALILGMFLAAPVQTATFAVG